MKRSSVDLPRTKTPRATGPLAALDDVPPFAQAFIEHVQLLSSCMSFPIKFSFTLTELRHINHMIILLKRVAFREAHEKFY